MTDILKQLETIDQITLAMQRLKGVMASYDVAYDLSRQGRPYTNEDLINKHRLEIHYELRRLHTLQIEAMKIAVLDDSTINKIANGELVRKSRKRNRRN